MRWSGVAIGTALTLAAMACSGRNVSGSAGVAPPPTATRSEISRERAIEIARAQVKFEARQTTAERVVEDDRPFWKVTFRGKPPGDGGLGEYMEVEVDAKTGDIVSLGMS